MDIITVKKVDSRKVMNDFVHFPRKHYQNCENYIPDLEMDMRKIFNPKKNAGLEVSDVQAFVAYQGTTPVGRIAAIVNHRANERWQKKDVRFGLIEFVDNLQVAEALLSAVEKYGKSMGMTRIVGPLGITDFDKEGMLVEDFDLEGSMTAIYNYPYYPQIMEQLGYQKEVDWVQIRVNIPQEIPAKYARVSQLTKEMFDLHVRQLTLKDFREGYGRKIFQLLNEAYAPIYGFTEFNEGQADAFVDKYLKLINLELLPVVENKQGEVIALAVTMGSLNKALRKANGRLLPFGWYHLLRSLKWKYEESAEMLLIAVRPDFQGLGVNAIFFDHLIPIYHKFGFKWAETGPQLDYNIRELSQWKPLNPDIVKRRRCYFKEIKN